MNSCSSSTTGSGQASDEGERSDDSRSSPDGQRAGYPETSSEGQGLCNAGHDSEGSTSEGQMASSRNGGSNSLACTPEEDEKEYLTHASASPQVNENSIDSLSDWFGSSASTVRELRTLQEQDNTSVVQNWDDESQNRDDIFQNGGVGVENSEAGFENGGAGHQNRGVGIQSSDAGIEDVDLGTGGVMPDIRSQRRINVLEPEEMERFLNHGRIGSIVATEPSVDHRPRERMSTIGDVAVNNPQPNCVQIGSCQQLLCSIEECMANKSTYALRNRMSGVFLSNQGIIRPIAGQYELGYEYTPWDNTRYGLDDRVMRCKDMGTNCKFIMKKYYPCNFNRWEVELPIRSSLSGFPCVLGLVWSQDVIQVFQESLDGIVLSELLQRRPILSGGEVNWLIFNMLKELEPIHQKGIVHRNLTPENIIISRKNRLYMVGGNSLCKITDCLSINPRRTLHSSPEIARGADHHWSTDIYSVGTIAHTCLSGEVSFFPIGRQQRSLENCIYEIGSGMYPVSNNLAGIEPSWQSMISTMTHPDMSKRPSANDLLRNYQEPEWQEGFFHPSFNPQEERPLPEIGDRVVNIPSDEILFNLGYDEEGEEGNGSVDENEESERDENTEGSAAAAEDKEQTYLVDQQPAPKKLESRVSSDSGIKTSPLNMFPPLSLKDAPSFSSAAGLARQASTSRDQSMAPSSSERGSPSRNQSMAPSSSERGSLSTNQSMAPSCSERGSPSRNQSMAPSSSERRSPSRNQFMAPSSSERGSPSRNQSMAPSSTRTQGYSRQSSEDENNFKIKVSENERDIGDVCLPRESYGRDLVTNVQAKFKLNCGVTLRVQGKIIRLDDNLNKMFPMRDVTVTMERLIRKPLIPIQDLSNASRSLPNIPTSGVNKVKAAYASSSLPYVLQPGRTGTKINPQVNQSDGACTSSRSVAVADEDVSNINHVTQDVAGIIPVTQNITTQNIPNIPPVTQDASDTTSVAQDSPNITLPLNVQNIIHAPNVQNISGSSSDPVLHQEFEDAIGSSPELPFGDGKQQSPRGHLTFESHDWLSLSEESRQFSESFVNDQISFGELNDDQFILCESDSSLVTHPGDESPRHDGHNDKKIKGTIVGKRIPLDGYNCVEIDNTSEERRGQIMIIDGNASAVVATSEAATDADDGDDEGVNEGDDGSDEEGEEDDGDDECDDEEDEDDNGIPSAAEDRGQQNSGSDDADELENEIEEAQDKGGEIHPVTSDPCYTTQTTSRRSRLRSFGAQELNLDEDLEDASKGSQIQNDNNSDEEKPDAEDVILDEANEDSCDDEKASDFALDSSNVILSEGNLNDTTGTGEDDQTENEDEYDAADAVLEASGVDSDVDSKEVKASVYVECSPNTFSEESNLFETTETKEEIDDNAENEDDAVQDKSEEGSQSMNDSGIGQNSSNDTFSEAATLTDEAFSPMSERDSFED